MGEGMEWIELRTVPHHLRTRSLEDCELARSFPLIREWGPSGGDFRVNGRRHAGPIFRQISNSFTTLKFELF